MQTARDFSSNACTVKKGQSCGSCSRSKVACSGLPCARCFKLCLQCQLQCTVYPNRPFVDIAMSMFNTDDFSSRCIELLQHYHRQGCLDRNALYHLICSWRHVVRVWGAERTQGLCKAICNVFGIASDQIPGHIWRRAKPQTKEAMAEVRQQLMRTSLFTLLDDGVSVLMAETMTGTGVAFAMNSASEAMLCSVQEADDLLERHQLLPIHLLACMIDPEDRLCLLKPYFNLCSTTRSNGCAFVKFCERDGTTDLSILRRRYMDLDLPNCPGSLTIAFTLQRAPAARYLTRRPGHRHCVIEQYARKRQDAHMEEAAATSPSISMFPAMAIVPAFDGARDHSKASAGRQKLIMQWTRAPSPPSTTETSSRSSPTISSSALTTAGMASALNGRTDSRSLQPLCWSSGPPSPIPWTHPEPSASAQVTRRMSVSVPTTSPLGLLPCSAHLPSTWISTLATTSPAAPLVVPMGVVWMPQCVSGAVAPLTTQEEGDDEILQAMRMLITE